MTTSFITSFSKAGWEAYGKRFIEAWLKYVNQPLTVYSEDMDIPAELNNSNIAWFNLMEEPGLKEFLLRHKENPMANGLVQQADGSFIVDFRWQATRFVNKVCALTSNRNYGATWRVWIDADSYATKPVSSDFFESLLSIHYDLYYIGRDKKVFNSSECGFVAYNLHNQDVVDFLTEFRQIYLSDAVFQLPEWHDSFVFDYLREKNNLNGFDLSHNVADMDPWKHTALQEYFTHEKGPKTKQKAIEAWLPKIQGPKNLMDICTGLTSRYAQLSAILNNYSHSNILEIGTHNGNRAVELCSINLKNGKPVHYMGYDLFEQGNALTNELELNAKGNPTMVSVQQKLDALKMQYPNLFTYELFAGNTNETLKQNPPPKVLDFVWLDGGHSIETIRNDLMAVEHAKLVVMDDFYHDECVDTSKFGCNEVVKSVRHINLPVMDTFGNGMKISLVATGTLVSMFGGDLGPTMVPLQNKPADQNQIKLKVQNCVENTTIQNNVRHGIEVAKTNGVEFVHSGYRVIPDRLIFVGGSGSVLDKHHPEYNKNWKAIRHASKHGGKVVAVKTSYDTCIEHNIIPWACILLDPRDHVSDKIAKPNPSSIFFISSMCHPTTWDRFGKFPKAVGYHASVGAGEEAVIHELLGQDAVVIHGGTTSGFRGISLMLNLGFRHFRMFGFDSSYPTKPAKAHGRSVKDSISVNVHGKTFWTDPELIAQSNDMEMLLKIYPKLDITFEGNGMLPHAATVMRGLFREHSGSKMTCEVPLSVYLKAWKDNNELGELATLEQVIHVLSKRLTKLKTDSQKLPAFTIVHK